MNKENRLTATQFVTVTEECNIIFMEEGTEKVFDYSKDYELIKDVSVSMIYATRENEFIVYLDSEEIQVLLLTGERNEKFRSIDTRTTRSSENIKSLQKFVL